MANHSIAVTLFRSLDLYRACAMNVFVLPFAVNLFFSFFRSPARVITGLHVNETIKVQ
jgi:hypothetical protein